MLLRRCSSPPLLLLCFCLHSCLPSPALLSPISLASPPVLSLKMLLLLPLHTPVVPLLLAPCGSLLKLLLLEGPLGLKLLLLL